MASWKYADDSNLGAVTLGSGYTAASGTMSLTAGHGARLPSSGDFWLGYDTGSGNRIFKVTARSTDTLTVVVDASEGLGDGNISSGETLRPVVTNDTITQLKADIVALSGLVFLKELTASASASLDFTARTDGTAIIQSDFDSYLIILLSVIPATNAVTMLFRVSTDGGSTYDSGNNYSYSAFRWSSTGSVVSGATPAAPTSSILLSAGDTLSNNSNYGMCGEILLINPGSAIYKRILGNNLAIHNSANSTNVTANIAGTYQSATAINAFRFITSSGNITSGVIRVYGIAKS